MLGAGKSVRRIYTALRSPIAKVMLGICASRPNVRICYNGFLSKALANGGGAVCGFQTSIYLRARGCPSAPGGTS